MNYLFYSKRSETALFIWPALAVNFNDGFWLELAWLSFAVGMVALKEIE